VTKGDFRALALLPYHFADAAWTREDWRMRAAFRWLAPLLICAVLPLKGRRR